MKQWNIPSDTCMLSDPFCLSSSELEDVVLQEDWHFLFMVMGTLQFSKYLQESEQHTDEFLISSIIGRIKQEVNLCQTQNMNMLFVPNDTVQTTDLLVGVDSFIIECHLLLKRSPTLLHSRPGLLQVERSGRVFGPHHRWALLYRLYWREAGS